MARHFLNDDDRLRIEALVKSGCKAKQIAEVIGCSERTIWRELRRGRCTLLNGDTWETYTTYSEQIAHADYWEKASHKGPQLKIGNDFAFVEIVERLIGIERYSPAAALAEIRLQNLQFKTHISVTTLYRYIYDGLFLNISASDLLVGRYKTKGHRKTVKGHGHSVHALDKHIGERPQEANDRSEPGHWEMDTVIGKRDDAKCILVLSDRCTRQEIVEKLRSRSSSEVCLALRRIRRKYPALVIKTLTPDNGVEFSNVKEMEKIAPVYFCHPYCSSERGTNENSNKMIRRFLPKGQSMDHLTSQQATYITNWMNNYPRKLLGWQRPKDYFALLTNNS